MESKVKLLQLLKTNVKLVIAVLITASVAGYITSWTKQSQMDQYIEEYEQFEEDAAVAREFADSLQEELAENDLEVQELQDSMIVIVSILNTSKDRIAELDRERQELKAQVTDSVLNETPPEVREYIAVVEEENEELKVALSAADLLQQNLENQVALLTMSLDTQTLRADSLYTIVMNIPEAPSNPNKVFGFIPKPSRIQSFFIGAALATVAAWKISESLHIH